MCLLHFGIGNPQGLPFQCLSKSLPILDNALVRVHRSKVLCGTSPVMPDRTEGRRVRGRFQYKSIELDYQEPALSGDSAHRTQIQDCEVDLVRG